MITRMSDVDATRRRCVLFDFDGTLADTKPTIIRTALTVLREWGIPEEELTRVDELVGPPFPAAFSMVFGVSDEDADEITRRYRQIYLNLGKEAWPLFDGTRELLERLRSAGRLVGLASSKRHETIMMSVGDNGVSELFDAISGMRPPEVLTKADAIAAVMGQLEVGADETVMVGDRYHDVEGADACGIPCVGVLFGDTATRGELVGAGAISVVDTVIELGEVLLG